MNSKKITNTVLISTLLLLAACSKNTDSKTPGDSELIAGNIVGGSVASSDFQKENGVVALLIDTDDGQGICTGTLISKKIVLTAAHCLDGSGGAIKSIAVVFTQEISKATQDTIRFGVKGKVHELFLSSVGGRGAWNDIALLKLNEDAPLDVKFAKLPSMVEAQLMPKTSLIQAGFGRTEANRSPTSDTSGTLKKVSGIELLKFAGDGKEMLLKEDGKGSCNGDSGGPAFVQSADGKLTQVGLNSRGTDPESCIGVGIFTNVASHLSWIHKNSDLLMAAETTPAPTPPTAN